MKNKLLLTAFSALVLSLSLTGCSSGGDEGEAPELGYEWQLSADKDREIGITARSEFLTYPEDPLASMYTETSVVELDEFRRFTRNTCNPLEVPNGILFNVVAPDSDVVYEVVDRSEDAPDVFKVYSPYTGSRVEYGVYPDVTYECLFRGASPSEYFPAQYDGELGDESDYVLNVIKVNFEYITGVPASDSTTWLQDNLEYIDVIPDCDATQFHDAFLTFPSSEYQALLDEGRPSYNTLLMTTSTIDPVSCYGYGMTTPNPELKFQEAQVMECLPLPVTYTCINVHK